MQELKANTEVIVHIGPFPDVGDGFTPQTDIALSGDEAELLKHGQTATVDISSNTWAAITNVRGWYNLTLTATDTNTEGCLEVIVQDDSDCLPVHVRFMVLAEAAWDSKYAAKDTGFMDVNIKAVGETATPHTSGKLHVLNGDGAAIVAAGPTKGEMDTAHALLATPAEVNTEVDNALNTAIPGTPTSNSINERIKTLDDHDLVTKVPGVVTAVGPTKAQMDTAHALLTTPAQVATALTNYDAPTKTEMDTAHALLATPAQVASALGTYDAPTKSEMDTAHALLATPAEVASALTTYDAPTKAEMDTAHALLATPAQVASALLTYDAPTKAEMDTALAALNDITVAQIIAGIADGSYDLQEMIRIIFAACSGISDGGGTTTIAFRDSADSKDRIEATVDEDGNRTAVTLDGS